MAYPELVRLQARIEALERQLAAAEAERDEAKRALTQQIPVADVHQHLDRLGAPRRDWGRPLLIGERFEEVRGWLMRGEDDNHGMERGGVGGGVNGGGLGPDQSLGRRDQRVPGPADRGEGGRARGAG